MFFSQRQGLKIVPEMQIEGMNDDLRVGLWNAFYNCFLSSFGAPPVANNELYEAQTELLYNIWIYVWKKPGDEFQREPKKLITTFKRCFLAEKWHEVFDVIEYAAAKYPREDVCYNFMLECNFVLEKEVSAYRFVDGVIVLAFEDYKESLTPEAGNIPLRVDHTRLQKALSIYSTLEKQKKTSVAIAPAAAKLKAAEKGTTVAGR